MLISRTLASKVGVELVSYKIKTGIESLYQTISCQKSNTITRQTNSKHPIFQLTTSVYILSVEPPVCQSCAHSLTPQPCLSDGERLSLNNIVSLHSDLINRLRRDERFPEMEEQSQCPRGDRRQSAASQPIKSTIPWKTAR